MLDYAHSHCRGCPSSKQCAVTRPLERAEVAIVVDFPSEMEDSHDEWMVSKRGGAGELLRKSIEALGVDIEDLYICSAVNCRPNPQKKAMVKNAMLSCRERLLDELKHAGVKKVLSVGPLAYSALMSFEKVEAITKVRGRWREAFGMQVMATLPPSFMFAGEEGRDYFRDFAHDLEKFFSTDGPDPHPNVEVWVPETLAELDEAFAFLFEQDFVSLDLETYGLSPIANDVLAAGFGTIDGTDGISVVVDEDLLSKKKTWRLIGKLLNDESIEVVFHNAKFDLQFLKTQLLKRGLRYAPANVHDTLLLHYLLDERPIGRFKSHGLETIARVTYDAPDYGIDMGKWLKEWESANAYDRRAMRQRMHVYLALDAYYTARLYPDLWNACIEDDEERERHIDPRLPSWQLLDTYERLLIPASLALADMEHHGVLLNRDMYEESREVLGEKARKLQGRIQRVTKIKDFNPGSPKQVQQYIYAPPNGSEDGLDMPFGLRTEDGRVMHTPRRGKLKEGATAAPVLRTLAHRFPEKLPKTRNGAPNIIEDICEYRNLTKNIGTYVNGLLQRLDVDGRMRTSFNIPGTSTGRLSSSGPNLQNIPDASHTGVEIRAGFVAPPGHVFVEADYKQLEVRIAAWLSGDPVMREIFRGGRDPHQEIAWSIYHKPKEEITHYMRWLAKNVLFGLLYGRGYESVATGPEQEDIAARGGRRWSIDEVKEFFDSLLAEWKVYAEWQREQKALGYRDGEIHMPTGRVRRFPFIPKHDAGYVGRASFNNPTQGTASDFTLNALIKLHERLPEGANLVLTVHDSILIECRQELADEVVELVRAIMEEEPLFELIVEDEPVPLKVDIEVTEVWGGDEFAKNERLVAAK